ncbi:MAG: diphosphate--fructose-6-phosphate 1-phosphotransferase [Candidatus Merdivicinus sp.]|jgi:6-phosphofructokinase
MGKNLVVAQSGGPSVAINATLAGVIAAAKDALPIKKIYGGLHGVEGMQAGKLVDLTDFSDLEKLKATPAMALGSCRCKLPPVDQCDAEIYQNLRKIFREYEIGYFLYIGGNDSMDTVYKLSRLFEGEPDAPVFMGVPKTIDNDLPLTDHTPGYGSAAKYLGITIGEIIRDTAIYNVPAVTIVEVMGRNAGWLTLAAGLPRFVGGSKPDIIAIPETPFDENRFLEQVRDVLQHSPNVVAVVSEGLRDAEGEYVGSSAKSGAVDVFGHAYLSGVGKYLEGLVKREIGCKVRSIELNLMQRCSSHLASLADIEEGFAIGKAGVAAALRGETGRMVAVERLSDTPYAIQLKTVAIEEVANLEQLVPEKWRQLDDPQVAREICDYILPLTQGDVPQFRNEFGMNEYVSFLD